MINVIQEEYSPFGNIIFIYPENSADRKSEDDAMISMNHCYPVWTPFSADVNFPIVLVILWCKCYRFLIRSAYTVSLT
jgi:hypothetical protein